MLKDRIKVITNTTGTGTLTLGIADSGFKDFSSISGQTYYAITNKSIWEVGLGTVSSGTLSRDEVYDSSNSGNRIDLNGKSTVFVTYPASKAVYLGPSSTPTSGDLLFRESNSWRSRPLSSGDIVTALGSSPLYTASGGVTLVGNNFSLGGTGYLDVLVANRRMRIGRQPSTNLDSFLVNDQPFASVGDRNFNLVASGTNVNQTSSFGISCFLGASGDLTASIAIGWSAGINVKNSVASNFIGLQAGNTSIGNYNTFIGGYAGASVIGDHNLEITTSKYVTSPNVLIGSNSYKLNIQGLIAGDAASKRLSIGNNDTSCLSPDATLQIVPSGTTTKGLMVKGAIAHSANLFEIDNSAGNNLFQIDSNGIPSGSRMLLSYGNGNILIGNTTGSLNHTDCIGIGLNAMRDGSNNNSVGIGCSAGWSSVSGSYNVCIGDMAGMSQTSSKQNVFIGNSAGSNGLNHQNNVSIGYYAGFSANNSLYNVAIGDTTAAYFEGSNNVLIGRAVAIFASGNYNVYIGKGAGFESFGNNNIEIVTDNDTSPIQNLSDKIHIQETIIGDLVSKKLAIGNVGFSNVNPNATLEILPRVSGNIGLMVKGVASHSANLFEVDNSSGGNLFTVAPNGLASGVKIATSGGLQLNSGIPSSTDSILYSNGSSLFWNGSKIVPNYSIKTASSAITYLSESDNVILLSSGRLGLFFSSTSNSHGKIFYVKSLRDDAIISPISIFNPLPPYDSVTDTIDGSSNDIYTKRYQSYALTPTSSGWMILSKYSNVVDGNL